jgi:hypothetical protein
MSIRGTIGTIEARTERAAFLRMRNPKILQYVFANATHGWSFR